MMYKLKFLLAKPWLNHKKWFSLTSYSSGLLAGAVRKNNKLWGTSTVTYCFDRMIVVMITYIKYIRRAIRFIWMSYLLPRLLWLISHETWLWCFDAWAERVMFQFISLSTNLMELELKKFSEPFLCKKCFLSFR